MKPCYYCELREVEAELRKIPGVKSAVAGGEEDIELEDIRALVHLSSGGTLYLYNLTPASFRPPARFTIFMAGGLWPRISSYGYSSVVDKDGRPVKSQGLGGAVEYGGESAFSYQLSHPLADVADAVARYEEIVTALEKWPRCPRFATHNGTDGTEYRFCAVLDPHECLNCPEPDERWQ